jgi:hypothetical protein
LRSGTNEQLVVVPQHLARLAVERLDALEFAVTRRDVRNARRLHVAAALVDERAFVALLLRRLLDAVEPVGRALAGGDGSSGCWALAGRD